MITSVLSTGGYGAEVLENFLGNNSFKVDRMRVIEKMNSLEVVVSGALSAY